MPEDPWRISLYIEEEPDIAAISQEIAMVANNLGIKAPELKISTLDDRDWVSEVQKNFVPINAEKFFIHDSNYNEPIPADKISIEMNAGRAFGTGEHETTGGCLKALSKISIIEKPKCLDMGCGSGILAIAMAKIWSAEVIAVDLDEQAVLVTIENLKLNHVSNVTVEQSNGYEASLVQDNAPYHVITSNILSAPLIAMAGDAYAALSKNGVIILAGLIESQAQDVINAHLKHGLILEQHIKSEHWPIIIMRKP